MVEPISMAVGTIIGVAGLYSVCLQAMEHIQDARNLEKDCKKFYTLFQSERFLFKAWGERVRIDIKTGVPHPCLDNTSPGYDIILSILENIRIISTDGDKLSKRYGIELARHSPGVTQSVAGGKKSSLVKKVIWAVKDKKGFGILVADVGAFVQKLHAMVDIQDGAGAEEVGEIHEKLQDLIEFVKDDANQRANAMINQHICWRGVTEYLSDNKRKELVNWVGAVSTERAFDDIIRVRHQNTCTWLFTNEKFLDWLRSADEIQDTSRVLWMHGGPGMGKSFISATAVEYFKGHSPYPTAFFFCSHEYTSMNQTLSIIRSWIVQLAMQRVEALQVLEFMGKGEPVPTTLWNIFCGILKAIGPCQLIVDGLDECLDYDPSSSVRGGGVVKRFLKDLLHFTGLHCAKILFLSRDIGDIRSGLLDGDQHSAQPPIGHRVIEYAIRTEDTAQDIRSIASHLVQSMNMKNPDKREETERKLSTRCEGMFLWLRLAGERLKPGMSNSQLTRTLESMPTGLDQAYSRDLAKLSRLGKADRMVGKDILRWLLFATRPLTVMELLHALAIRGESGTVQYDDIPDQIDQKVIQAQILDMCGSLVHIREGPRTERTYKYQLDNYTVHFVHFSVKEFLLNGTHELEDSARETFFFRTPGNSHSILTKYSLTYLLSDPIKPLSAAKAVSPVTPRSPVKEVRKEFSIYASIAWLEHLRLSSAEAAMRLVDLQARLFKPGPTFERWRQVAIPDQRINPLETASWLNLLEVSRVIVKNPQTYQKIPRLAVGRALHLATLRGNSDILRLLLAQPGVDVNTLLAGRYHYPQEALLAGEKRDVHAFRYLGKRPLHVACQEGHKHIIELLLAREDVNKNLTDEDGQTPLHCSCTSRQREVVQMLLGCKDVDVNAVNKRHETPLLAAIQTHDEMIIKLLIENGARLDTVSPSGRTLLHAAVCTSNKALMERLIANGADVNTADQWGMTPLHDAISMTVGDNMRWRSDLPTIGKLVALLIESGADVNTVDPHGTPPLHTVIKSNNPELVKLLINNGADVNTVDPHRTPSLHVAIESDNEEIVKLLIVNGANVNAVDKNSNTPLHKVIGRKAKGERARASSLDLRTWPSVRRPKDEFMNSRDQPRITARHTRRPGRYMEVIEQLLARGTDVNAINVNGSTPLDVAIAATQTDVIGLIKRYTDIPAIDNHGQISLNLELPSGPNACPKLLQQANASKAIQNTVEGITDNRMMDKGTEINQTTAPPSLSTPGKALDESTAAVTDPVPEEKGTETKILPLGESHCVSSTSGDSGPAERSASEVTDGTAALASDHPVEISHAIDETTLPATDGTVLGTNQLIEAESSSLQLVDEITSPNQPPTVSSPNSQRGIDELKSPRKTIDNTSMLATDHPTLKEVADIALLQVPRPPTPSSPNSHTETDQSPTASDTTDEMRTPIAGRTDVEVPTEISTREPGVPNKRGASRIHRMIGAVGSPEDKPDSNEESSGAPMIVQTGGFIPPPSELRNRNAPGIRTTVFAIESPADEDELISETPRNKSYPHGMALLVLDVICFLYGWDISLVPIVEFFISTLFLVMDKYRSMAGAQDHKPDSG